MAKLLGVLPLSLLLFGLFRRTHTKSYQLRTGRALMDPQASSGGAPHHLRELLVVTDMPAVLTATMQHLMVLAPSSDEHGQAVQKEIGALVACLPSVLIAGDAVLAKQVVFAAAALSANPPRLEMARTIREGVERKITRRSSYLRMILRSDSPAAKVILGLGFLLYFAIPICAGVARYVFSHEKLLGIDTSLLVLVAIAGALGSIVSIVIRLNDFAAAPHQDPTLMFFTGFFKPIIGSGLALFAFAALKGVLPITIKPEVEPYFFAALSFLMGFSERFAQDVVQKTEDAIGVKRATETKTTVVNVATGDSTMKTVREEKTSELLARAKPTVGDVPKP